MSIAVCFLLLSGTYQKSSVVDDLREAFLKGNVAGVSTYFETSLEIEFPGISGGPCSAAEARTRLEEFFRNHPPAQVGIRHKGPAAANSYAVLSYGARTGGQFRITIYLLRSGELWRIQELTVEKS